MVRHAGLRRSFICCFFCCFFPVLLCSKRKREKERRGRSARSLARSRGGFRGNRGERSVREPQLGGRRVSRAVTPRGRHPLPLLLPPLHIFFTRTSRSQTREKNIHNCNNRFCDAFKDPRCCSPFPDEVFSFYFLSAAESYGCFLGGCFASPLRARKKIGKHRTVPKEKKNPKYVKPLSTWRVVVEGGGRRRIGRGRRGGGGEEELRLH